MRRLISLALATALMLTTTGAAAARRSGSPWAGSDGVLQVMPLGDSITRGHGTDGFRADLRARLAAVGMVPNFVGPWIDGTGDNNHAGTSGARIDQINAQVPQLMKDYQPDVVLVMLGTNDVGQQYQLDTVTTRVHALLLRIAQFRPSARVFVGTVPVIDDPVRQVQVDALNQDVRDAVVLLNSPRYTIVPTHIVGQDAARDLLSDGVHPTACGYAKLAFVWFEHMDASDLAPGDWPGGYWPWSNTGVCA